jgi:hypothetical protein
MQSVGAMIFDPAARPPLFFILLCGKFSAAIFGITGHTVYSTSKWRAMMFYIS